MKTDEEKRRYIQSECTKLGARLSKELGIGEVGLKDEMKPVFPQKGDNVFRITSAGKIVNHPYNNNEKGRARKKFLGYFRTRELAQVRLDFVMKALKGETSEKWVPEMGETFYVVSAFNTHEHKWEGTESEIRWLKDGEVFKTESEAISYLSTR